MAAIVTRHNASAAAIVDRLTFKSFIIDMNGPSYRLKATEQWINERKNTDKKHK